MQQPDLTIETFVKRSRYKLMKSSLLFASLAFASAFILLPAVADGRSDPEIFWFAWAGILIGVVVVARSIWDMFCLPEDVLSIGPNGIRDVTESEKAVTWSEVKRLTVIQSYFGLYAFLPKSKRVMGVCIDLAPETVERLGLSYWSRRNYPMNRGKGATGMIVTGYGTSLRTSELVDTILAYARVHNPNIEIRT